MDKNKTPQDHDSSGKLTRREFLRRSAIVGASALAASCAPGAFPTAPAQAPAEAPAVKESITIKWAHYFDPLQSPAQQKNYDWMQGIVEGFEQENPNITVEPEYFDWDKIDNRSILDFEAGIKHDLVFGSPQLMPKHFQVGDFMDLGLYLDTWSQSEIEDFSWSPVWSKSGMGGSQIAVPTGVHTRAVAYRRDMFEEAGLDPDSPPQTWEETLEAAQATTTEEVSGLAMYFGPSRATIELFFAPYVWHFGGDLWDPESGEAAFASEAGQQAAQVVYDLLYTHGVTPKSSVGGTYDDAVLAVFLNNQAAMAWGFGSYWIATLEDQFTSGCFPASEDCTEESGGVFVTPTKPQAQFTNAWTLSIHQLSAYPDEAFKLLEYIVQPENLHEFPDAGLPTRLTLWERDEYQSEFYQKWLTAAEHGRPMPATVNYPELADTCAACLQEILVNQAPIPETLQEFQDEWNSKYAGA